MNVWAPWKLIQRVLPGMLDRGRGWILNIGSGSGLPSSPARPGQGLYSATKVGLLAASRCLAAEIEGRGVAVNVLMPQGAALTEMMDAWVGDGKLDPDLTEPLEAMAEAALVLCTGDPNDFHGRVCKSLEFLVEQNRAALDLSGTSVVAGGAPDEMAANIATIAMGSARKHDLRKAMNAGKGA